jgi:multisubunit Na+/H+ antiporter MnhF subunit
MAINVIVNLAIVIASEKILVSFLGLRVKPNIRDRVVVGGLLIHGFRV